MCSFLKSQRTQAEIWRLLGGNQSLYHLSYLSALRLYPECMFPEYTFPDHFFILISIISNALYQGSGIQLLGVHLIWVWIKTWMIIWEIDVVEIVVLWKRAFGMKTRTLFVLLSESSLKYPSVWNKKMTFLNSKTSFILLSFNQNNWLNITKVSLLKP